MNPLFGDSRYLPGGSIDAVMDSLHMSNALREEPPMGTGAKRTKWRVRFEELNHRTGKPTGFYAERFVEGWQGMSFSVFSWKLYAICGQLTQELSNIAIAAWTVTKRKKEEAIINDNANEKTTKPGDRHAGDLLQRESSRSAAAARTSCDDCHERVEGSTA